MEAICSLNPLLSVLYSVMNFLTKIARVTKTQCFGNNIFGVFSFFEERAGDVHLETG